MEKSPEACVHCGKCLSTCPSYRFFLQESFSPRGRNLLLSQDLQADSLDYCLFCENCAIACPQGLSFPEFYLKKIFKESKLHLPIRQDPLTLLSLHPEGKRIYQNLDTSSFWHSTRGDFYLYLSCGLKHLYPSALLKVLEKLKVLKIKPYVPEGEDCCGILYVSLKAPSTLRELALRKLELFSEEKPVITFCATCLWVFKRVYPLLFQGRAEEEAFKDLAERTYFVLDFLRHLGLKLAFQEDPSILYHLPCHLKKGLTSEEKALKNILKVNSFCCGSAKLTLWLKGFQRDYLRHWKGELLGKRFIGTACTGCFLSFGLQVRRPPEIKHWMDFLA